MAEAVKTAEKQAYDKLRTLIIDGDIPINEFLSQRKLADMVGAATGTVRTALRRLENEGLIESVPKWGVRVPFLTEEMVRDRNFMREVYETAAVEKCAGKLTNDQAEQLMSITKESDRLRSKHTMDVEAFAEIHLSLHQFIVDCADSPLLSRSFANLQARDRMLYNARYGKGETVTDKTHHQKLAEVIISGPKAAALTAIRKHVRDGLVAELAAIEAQEKK